MSFDPEQTPEKLIQMKAAVHGYGERTVRLNDGKVPCATCTYNYNQCDDTKAEVARRIAALWNLAIGVPTADLERYVAAGASLVKRKDR